jgi:two-component system phosphate regulon sensor histidine kinase PhoR
MNNGNSDKYLNVIKSSAVCMENLLNDTSLITRLENGEKVSPLSVIDIGEQLAWAVDAIRGNALSKEIGIHLIGELSCRVKGNLTAVRQIFINLLSNAVKYNRKQGKIWIFTEESDDWIEVNIKDSGYGISEDETLKIFEKFYRAKGSEIAKGSGLGLYLVKLLMEALCGNVRVQSRKGIGSIFTLSFKKEKELSLFL